MRFHFPSNQGLPCTSGHQIRNTIEAAKIFQSPRFFPTVAGFQRPERKPGPKSVARKLGDATAQVVKSSYEQLKDAPCPEGGGLGYSVE